jgi:hypothetical protein
VTPTETPTKTETASFLSRSPNLRLTVRPPRFEKRHVDGRVIEPADAGLAVQFKQNRVDLDDPELIEFMRNHRLINRFDGFWEEGRAPDEPRPTLTDQQGALTKAAMQLDVEGIKAVIAEEERTHNRVAVLEPARDALAMIEAELDKQAQAAPAEVETPATEDPGDAEG